MIEIAVAVIAGLTAVTVAMIERSRRQNSREHNMVYDKITMMEKHIDQRLDSTEGHVQRIDEKLDDHIEWHLNDRRTK
jgi:hypothetical protein